MSEDEYIEDGENLEIDNTKYYSIIIRHDTSTNWAIENPILLLSEYAVEDDTHKVKRGDGKSKWNDLPYETFGINLDASFKNIQGNVEDNQQLKEAFDDVIKKNLFEDTGKILSDIQLSSTDDTILNIEKAIADINYNNITKELFVIKSPDNSIKSVWKVNGQGKEELNISAVSTISEYTLNTLYQVGELCFYAGNLYICKKEVQPCQVFDESYWSLIGETQAELISFDNTSTTLEAITVQDAVNELDTKVNDVSDSLTWNVYE